MKPLSQADYDDMMRDINKSVMGGNFTLFNSYTNEVIKEDANQASIGFVKFEFILNLLKNKQTKSIVVRAEEILSCMQSFFDEPGEHNVKPNTITYNAVIKALSPCKNAQRAENMLQAMIDR